MRVLVSLCLLLVFAACEEPDTVPIEPEASGSGTIAEGLDSLGLPRTFEIVADTTLTVPISGRLGAPVPIRIYRLWESGEEGYAFVSASGVQLGPGVSPHLGGTDAQLIDLNFDGWADLWVQRYEHQRLFGSDVWVYVPDGLALDDMGPTLTTGAPGYVFSSELSRLPNLSVDTTAQRIEAGIGNCGCAGACFYSGVYRWESNRLVMEKRLYHECRAHDFRYRTWERRNGELVPVTDRIDLFGDVSEDEIRRRRDTGLTLFN